MGFGDAEMDERVAAKDSEGREVIELKRADERLIVFHVEGGKQDVGVLLCQHMVFGFEVAAHSAPFGAQANHEQLC